MSLSKRQRAKQFAQSELDGMQGAPKGFITFIPDWFPVKSHPGYRVWFTAEPDGEWWKCVRA